MARRIYTQVARAELTEATRRSILDAAQSLFLEDGLFDPPLPLIAERAGTTTRTILRHFGSKDGLISAAIEDGSAEVQRKRAAASGDVGGSIAKLIDHYEESGDQTMRLIAEAERYPLVARIVRNGEAVHRDWVCEVFAPQLEPLTGVERDRRIALLASVTDLYMWSLMRRRYGRSRAETETAISGLVQHTMRR